MGKGALPANFDIRWDAHDQNMGTRPVSLSFSEKADGPWTTIASGLPNGGQFYWAVDSRVPKKIFVRLEVRDEAGNATQNQTPQAISLEGLTPGGRIKAVHTSKNLMLGTMRK